MKSNVIYIIGIGILAIISLYLYFGQVQSLKNERDEAIEEKAALNAEIEQLNASIESLEELLQVDLVGQIHFESGSAHLTDESKHSLDQLVDKLRGQPDKNIMVVGHTDDRSLIPTFPRIYSTNWELSTGRATQVVRYLQEKGIEPARIKAAGKSKYHPIASNETAEGRAQNRRAEIYLVPER